MLSRIAQRTTRSKRGTNVLNMRKIKSQNPSVLLFNHSLNLVVFRSFAAKTNMNKKTKKKKSSKKDAKIKLDTTEQIPPTTTNTSELTTDCINIIIRDQDCTVSIPLPGEGTQLFTLPRTKDGFSKLSADIKLEDHLVKRVDIINLDTNERIAKSTHMDRVICMNWGLRINDTTYPVHTPPITRELSKSLGKSVIESEFSDVKEYLNSIKTPEISYKEYITTCEDMGLSKEKANLYLDGAHQSGLVLYFGNNIELQDKIFVYPENVISDIESSLDLPSIRLNQVEKIKLLEKIEDELCEMQITKDLLTNKAQFQAKAIAISGLAVLFAQFFIFARLTWWDYSWDVIEPFTYFTTVVETVIAGYVFYLFSRSDYSHSTYRDVLSIWRFKSMARNEGFDPVKYNTLKVRKQTLENEIKVYEQLKTSRT
eukprot:TRINITY_DN1353_c1_g2_i1.p1 TRINITY_DN1353_c1_g2~~TRINITY_DN1353_c1_g2_i1.p1  ORF type:complete len:426 (+),score=65.25 TRINITY_DN1353_c1_g2_i1:33-1310(+)